MKLVYSILIARSLWAVIGQYIKYSLYWTVAYFRGFRAGATLCNNICTVLATVQMLQHVTDDMPGYMWVNTEKACIFKQRALQCSFRAKIMKNWTWSDIAPCRSVVMSSGKMLVGLVIAQWVVGCSLDRLWQHNLSVMVLSFLFVFSCVMVLGFKFVISYFIV